MSKRLDKTEKQARTSQQILRPSYIPLGWTTLTRPKNVQTSGQIYRKELNAMDNLFRHLKRNSKQILSFMLAFVVLMENPVSAYASTATSSDAIYIKKPVVTSTETTTQTNTTAKATAEDTEPTTTNFNSDTYTGEPFYFDENGNVIYDSEDEELQELREQIAESLEETDPSDYSDIAWTFDEYPLTTINTTGDSDIVTYVAGVDDAAYAILGIAAAAAGVYVGKDAIQNFASTQFEPWARRTFGNDSAKMKTLQDWLDVGATSAAISFTGMKSLTSMVSNFFGTATWEGTKGTYQTGAPSLKGKYGFISSNAIYLGSTTWRYSSNAYYQADVAAFYNPANYLKTGLYYSYNSSYGGGLLYQGVAEKDTSDPSGIKASFSGDSLPLYYNIYDDGNFYRYDKAQVTGTSYSRIYMPANAALSLGYLVFNGSNSLKSYLVYGTTGGLISAADYPITGTSQMETISAKKTWPALRSNFFNNYTPSDTITLPSSSSAIERLLAAIYASDTADEVVSNINSVWKITKNANTVLTAEEAYSNLQYVLAAIATSLGASVTTSDIDEFITSYYGDYVDGTSARKEDQADEILKNYVVIEGGGNNGDPDNDDKDKNKYTVAMKLAATLGTFLIAKGAIETLTDFKENPNISANITVDAVSGAEPEPTPSPGTNPSTPSTGESTVKVDLSGVLEYLKNITNILTAWANPLTLIDTLASKLDLGSIKSSVLSLPDAIAQSLGLKNLLDGLELPKLFSDTVQSINALPATLAQELALPSQFENLGRIIELLPDKLTLGFALPDLFANLGTIVGAIPGSIAELLPGVLTSTLPNILADTFGLVDAFSLPNILKAIQEALASLPEAIADAMNKTPSGGGGDTSDDEEESDDGSGLFENILDILMYIILIIVALLVLFLNCLKLIVNLYQVPASTVLFNDDVLKGLEFLKSINIPFPGTKGIGLFALLMSCVYFVLFASVIATLRKKIEKFHV